MSSVAEIAERMQRSQAIDKVRRQAIPPPSRINPLVSRDLDAVCRCCLEKLPDHRYDSAGQLADDLSRVLDGRPVAARTITAWERFGRWRRRNPAIAWLATSVLLLLTMFAVGATTSIILLARANRASQGALHHETVARHELQTETQTALRNVYESRKLANWSAQHWASSCLPAPIFQDPAPRAGLIEWRCLAGVSPQAGELAISGASQAVPGRRAGRLAGGVWLCRRSGCNLDRRSCTRTAE